MLNQEKLLSNENNKIKVIDCDDCPFCVNDYDADAIGYSNVLYCGLEKFVNHKHLIIAVYDSLDEENIKIETPKNCPLNNRELIITKPQTK